MHGRLFRPAVTAAAALTTLGLTAAGATAATGSAARKAPGKIFAVNHAGYRAGFGTGWRFRWATTTFTIPDCSDPATAHGWTGNGLQIGANSSRWQASIGAGCGTATTGAAVDYVLLTDGHAVMPADIGLLPLAGHKVTLSVYYDRRHGTVRFVAGDDTSLDAVTRTVRVGTGANYYGAEVGSQFGGTISAPPTDVRTGAFSDSHLTSYSGRRGTMLSLWPTDQVIATVGGAPDGDLIANAPALWNGGRNFSVWERTTAHS
jgi:hypothetical protein